MFILAESIITIPELNDLQIRFNTEVKLTNRAQIELKAPENDTTQLMQKRKKIILFIAIFLIIILCVVLGLNMSGIIKLF